ncbi:M12 family metallopeptidase [Mariniflexile litorale]|uniref:M12 family metallopeptidase n=1 Tax=Mariniflexile litorale TaxID=3045158 RepID=A0AAU7EEM9_9FLAO|nr:M12 family metallopeptidase [Mariniflexile sp. KMM 9835]MDQ8211435.1 M12 family metallopeptidase [Mariniflexile sp. KMM 9835]
MKKKIHRYSVLFTIATLFLVSILTWLIIKNNNRSFRPPLEYHSLKSGKKKHIKIVTQLSFTDKDQEIICELVDSLLVIEGDIIIGKIEDFQVQTMAAIKGEGVLWKDGIIPYEIKNGHPKEILIKKAIKYLNNETNLKLIEKGSKDIDYIRFVKSNGCSSWVGKQGEEQIIKVGDCSFGSIVHEILHAAGFYHEQARTDRDEYIEIVWDNVQSDEKHNFMKYIDRGEEGEDIGEYDYNSVMHYDSMGFSSKNNNKTILIRKPPGNEKTIIGQRKGLSSNDVKNINKVYN